MSSIRRSGYFSSLKPYPKAKRALLEWSDPTESLPIQNGTFPQCVLLLGQKGLSSDGSQPADCPPFGLQLPRPQVQKQRLLHLEMPFFVDLDSNGHREGRQRHDRLGPNDVLQPLLHLMPLSTLHQMEPACHPGFHHFPDPKWRPSQLGWPTAIPTNGKPGMPAPSRKTVPAGATQVERVPTWFPMPTILAYSRPVPTLHPQTMNVATTHRWRRKNHLPSGQACHRQPSHAIHA